ncbi:MAG: hypothetical protein KAX49_16380 [Halanaerobiales bacterium]|nr:hypothetical protein [Halanaerobiales bacterium]
MFIKAKSYIIILVIVLGCILLVREPMLAGQHESNGDGDKERIYYEVNDYKIFDFIEPEIHPLYVLSAEPEVEIFQSIVNNFLEDYCNSNPDLRSLKDNRKVREKHIYYSNDYANIYLHKNGRVYFSTRNYFLCRKKNYLNEIHNLIEINNEELLQKAEKFIENYLGGFRKDLKPEIRSGNEIVFHQYIDGVKISQIVYEPGITIEYYKNNVIRFVRFTFNIEKCELISQNILGPIECIEKSINFLKNYKGDKWIKFTEVNLAYFPSSYLENGSEKFKMIPAWEFTNQDHNEYIYLDVFTGKILYYWLGML